jgi:hypothetical protein
MIRGARIFNHFGLNLRKVMNTILALPTSSSDSEQDFTTDNNFIIRTVEDVVEGKFNRTTNVE